MALASPALAHGIFSGPPGFLSGLTHPYSVPAQILLLVGLGVLTGQNGLGRLRVAAPVFAGSVLFGMAVTLVRLQVAFLGEGLFLLAALAGLLAALEFPLRNRVLIPAVALGGLGLGLDSAVSTGSWTLTFSALGGALLSASITFAYLVALVAIIYRDKPAWMRIGVRIVGSWTAAIAILLLALIFLTIPKMT